MPFHFHPLHYPPSQSPYIQSFSFQGDSFLIDILLHISKRQEFEHGGFLMNYLANWFNLSHRSYKKQIAFPFWNLHSYGLYDFLVLEVLIIQLSVEIELIIVKLRAQGLCLLTCMKTLYSNTFKKESKMGILDYLSSWFLKKVCEFTLLVQNIFCHCSD